MACERTYVILLSQTGQKIIQLTINEKKDSSHFSLNIHKGENVRDFPACGFDMDDIGIRIPHVLV